MGATHSAAPITMSNDHYSIRRTWELLKEQRIFHGRHVFWLTSPKWSNLERRDPKSWQSQSLNEWLPLFRVQRPSAVTQRRPKPKERGSTLCIRWDSAHCQNQEPDAIGRSNHFLAALCRFQGPKSFPALRSRWWMMWQRPLHQTGAEGSSKTSEEGLTSRKWYCCQAG